MSNNCKLVNSDVTRSKTSLCWQGHNWYAAEYDWLLDMSICIAVGLGDIEKRGCKLTADPEDDPPGIRSEQAGLTGVP